MIGVIVRIAQRPWRDHEQRDKKSEQKGKHRAGAAPQHRHGGENQTRHQNHVSVINCRSAGPPEFHPQSRHIKRQVAQIIVKIPVRHLPIENVPGAGKKYRCIPGTAIHGGRPELENHGCQNGKHTATLPAKRKALLFRN